jgi:hypothetical protein
LREHAVARARPEQHEQQDQDSTDMHLLSRYPYTILNESAMNQAECAWMPRGGVQGDRAVLYNRASD